MPSPLILPVNEIPKQELMGIDKIREMIPQRYEMEQLGGILLFDRERGIAIGYRDVTNGDFWVRGHIPGRPLMPGVLMCEAAAQLCSFYFKMCKPEAKDAFLGFGGMDNVRFRGTVVPGDRFIIIVKSTKFDARLNIFETQGIVGEKLVFEARISGIQV
ncbi:MAG TPA: 3-hydroxyacyl-ACP dehydratase FabZ family protein [Planctomycetota bacterium]|nr:3-hydroxyacyl-ACP dehydratase FabZ family protein [Planctomycetota bacterium]